MLSDELFCLCSANVKAICSAITFMSQGGNNWVWRSKGKTKHWVTGNGSLLLTPASPTARFSLSMWTVAAASLPLQGAALHPCLCKMQQDAQGTASLQDSATGWRQGTSLCHNRHAAARRRRQSPPGKPVPEPLHLEQCLGKGCSYRSVIHTAGESCLWAHAPVTAMWQSAYIPCIMSMTSASPWVWVILQPNVLRACIEDHYIWVRKAEILTFSFPCI